MAEQGVDESQRKAAKVVGLAYLLAILPALFTEWPDRLRGRPGAECPGAVRLVRGSGRVAAFPESGRQLRTEHLRRDDRQ